MFTGIIEETVPVQSFSEQVLCVVRPPAFEEISLGQSIAVNGACLSVSQWDEETLSFFLAEETLQKTNLSGAREVHLERSMLAQARFEGHVVLGHVDLQIPFLRREGENFFFHLPEKWIAYCPEKGSVALDGISLTIAERNGTYFRIAIIPLTEQKTRFSRLVPGEMINFEADYFAKLVLQNRLSCADPA